MRDVLYCLYTTVVSITVFLVIQMFLGSAFIDVEQAREAGFKCKVLRCEKVEK